MKITLLLTTLLAILLASCDSPNSAQAEDVTTEKEAYTEPVIDTVVDADISAWVEKTSPSKIDICIDLLGNDSLTSTEFMNECDKIKDNAVNVPNVKGKSLVGTASSVYSELMKCPAFTVQLLKRPDLALGTRTATQRAVELSFDIVPDDAEGYGGGKRDAVRHGLWSALIVKAHAGKYSTVRSHSSARSYARGLTNVYETCTWNPPYDHEMDYHNNATSSWIAWDESWSRSNWYTSWYITDPESEIIASVKSRLRYTPVRRGYRARHLPNPDLYGTVLKYNHRYTSDDHVLIYHQKDISNELVEWW